MSSEWSKRVCALHAHGNGRWVVDVISPGQAMRQSPFDGLAVDFAMSVIEGRKPLCACCDHCWSAPHIDAPALLFVATPSGRGPEGRLVCGVCQTCADTKDMRKEVERWIGLLYQGKITTTNVQDYTGNA
jgi:hypothetical protein